MRLNLTFTGTEQQNLGDEFENMMAIGVLDLVGTKEIVERRNDVGAIEAAIESFVIGRDT